MEIAMRIFTRFIAEDRFHDAHIAALDAACEVPGGYDRQFLTALRGIAQGRLLHNEANPVPTDGPEWAVTARRDNRDRDNRRLREIAGLATILLEGVPSEFEEASIELEHWLAEDPSNIEAAAYHAVRSSALLRNVATGLIAGMDEGCA
jgi:hypothetical protein